MSAEIEKPPLRELQGRELRAYTDIEDVSHFMGSKYYVKSASSGNQYLVDPDGPFCSCPDYQLGNHCKHLRRVAIEITQETVKPPE